MRNLITALAFACTISLAFDSPSLAGCGPDNPNCVVPTAPTSDNSNRAANTAWVRNFFGLGIPLPNGQIFIGSASNVASPQTPSGDLAMSNGGVFTFNTVNSNVGSFGSNTQCITFTVNAKGLITAASMATCAPAVGSITGFGTGVGTALALPANASGGLVTWPVQAAALPFPTISTLGGVMAKDCSPGSQVIQKINTDGTVTCVTTSGTGTVTEQKNTVTTALVTSGNCDNTTTNAGSPCNIAMTLDSNVLEVDTGLGTTATTNTMMGWGVTSCRVTPKYSSRMWVEVTGVLSENSGTTSTIQLRSGTGAGPSQGGSTASGTAIGTTASVNGGGTTTISAPFKIGGIVTGLTPGTAIWIDGAITFTNGGIGNLGCRAHEVM